MTNVVTVSAATAAYALEPLRPSARVSGATPAQESMKALANEARKADKSLHTARMQEVGQAALALFFLNAGQQQKSLQQATYGQAAEAYLEQDYDLPENHEEQHEAGDDEASDDDTDAEMMADTAETVEEEIASTTLDEFGLPEPEILALPAPQAAS